MTQPDAGPTEAPLAVGPQWYPSHIHNRTMDRGLRSDPKPDLDPPFNTVSVAANRRGPYRYAAPLLRFATTSVSNSTIRCAPRVLDLCCGTGSLLTHFAEARWSCVGVDACPELVSTARATDATEHNTWLVASDVVEIVVRDSEFDLVVGFDEVAVDMRDDVWRGDIIDVAFRALAVGGHFVFEIERDCASPIDARVLDELRSRGFMAAWMASPALLEQPMTIAHAGPRNLFVARKDY